MTKSAASHPSHGAVPVWVYDDPMFGTGACARVPDDDGDGDTAYTAYIGTEDEIKERVQGAVLASCPNCFNDGLGCDACDGQLAAILAALRGEG